MDDGIKHIKLTGDFYRYYWKLAGKDHGPSHSIYINHLDVYGCSKYIYLFARCVYIQKRIYGTNIVDDHIPGIIKLTINPQQNYAITAWKVFNDSDKYKNYLKNDYVSRTPNDTSTHNDIARVAYYNYSKLCNNTNKSKQLIIIDYDNKSNV
jgi:hypothetical protein